MVMRKGMSHRWKYSGVWSEKKIAPGVWYIRFKAGKSQPGRPGVGKGSRYQWRIRATQNALKTAPGRYDTIMTGKKYLISARPRGRL